MSGGYAGSFFRRVELGDWALGNKPIQEDSFWRLVRELLKEVQVRRLVRKLFKKEAGH